MVIGGVVENQDRFFHGVTLSEGGNNAPLHPVHEHVPVHCFVVVGSYLLACREMHLTC